MLFSELENYLLNQVDIKIYGNYEIIKVPGQNEDPRRDPYMALKVYVIMSRIHATGGI